MEDQHLAELFRNQAKAELSAVEFRDHAVREADDSWKERCDEIIQTSAATICLIGRRTHQSKAVDWELRRTAELGKPLMGVYLENETLPTPRALADLGVQPVPWELDRIVCELDRTLDGRAAR